MNSIIFSAKDVYKKYGGHQALNEFNMEIPRGSIYGFVGENGAGKTTLFRLMAGLDFPTSGELSLFGETTQKGMIEQRKRAGFIIETPALYLDMTARQNMEMIRIQRGIPEKEAINEMLSLLSLQNTGNKRVRNFSLGMKQRLGIAMALLGDPEFLILDEPINGLDPTGILEARTLLKKINIEKETTILISSHILSELDNMATHYGFVHHGKMLQEITAEKLGEKCRRYLRLRASAPEKAAVLLETQLNTTKFEIYPDKSIHLYDYIDRSSEVSFCLAKNQILIEEMTVCGDDLETYFEKLIGGK